MGIEIVDVIYTEDEEAKRIGAQECAARLNLSYRDAASLVELEEILKSTRAKAYVLDGEFPLCEGRDTEYNADIAVQVIRNIAGAGTRIILFSANDDAQKLAKQMRVDCIEKGCNGTPRTVMQHIKDMISAED